MSCLDLISSFSVQLILPQSFSCECMREAEGVVVEGNSAFFLRLIFSVKFDLSWLHL